MTVLPENLAEGLAALDQNRNKHSKRRPYRQYEDEQIIIDKIREHRRKRYPDSEIMKLLENMPRSTYYDYVKKMQQQDKELIEQLMQNNLHQVAEEYNTFRENACHILCKLQAIIDNDKTSNYEKLRALQQYCDVSRSLVTLSEQSVVKMRAVEYRDEQRARQIHSKRELEQFKKTIEGDDKQDTPAEMAN